MVLKYFKQGSGRLSYIVNNQMFLFFFYLLSTDLKKKPNIDAVQNVSYGLIVHYWLIIEKIISKPFISFLFA